MKVHLLDTQILLWAAADPTRLTPETASLLGDTTQSVVVSAVSIAEIVIKQSIGKLSMSVTPIELCRKLRLELIPLTADDSQRLASVPLLHRDPFDRLLIAQAIERSATLVTSDRRIWEYEDVNMLRNP
jgi:PIN domain nuclease of toxin-antitoxin system